jgi:phosphatidylserine/phosphatidylglycerophosphate/cardiolipin synthase-like enzyme
VGTVPDLHDPTDWLLTKSGRGNPSTRLDDVHPGDRAWSEGNLVRPLVHGATYFAELFERLEETRDGDLVMFTDWQGDYDERLTGGPGSEVGDVLCRADERGVDVRGLVWRSHAEAIGFTSAQNRHLGEKLQARGAEALLDMRVRLGGSHHQKMVVIRYRDQPERDIAYVGGIDLCHSRRDDAEHLGDPQAMALASEYGGTPPWHDIQAAITGPAVYDVETVFRERWLDPTPLSRSPLRYLQDRLTHLDLSPDPLPEQAPPPPEADGGTHAVQLLRTYPDLRLNRDYPFANGGERSVARGYTKAVTRAQKIIYVEDQYLWGHHVGNVFTEALRDNPDLHVIAVVPLHPDLDGASRVPQLVGRRRAMQEMLRAAPGRVAVYGIENHEGTPVYVHAKACIIDDTWATVGSDNFNRRSWTHDSELSAVVVDRDGEYARRLRLTLAAEHLDRTPGPGALLEELADCVEPAGMFAAFEESATRLDEWYAAGQPGERPPGRLRRLHPPELGRFKVALASPMYLWVHDPDGRPRALRRRDRF